MFPTISVSQVHILKVIVERNKYWSIHMKKSHPVPPQLSEFSKLKIGISYYHKIIQVGKDLRKSLIKPPAQIKASNGIRPESIGLWTVKWCHSASFLFQLVPIASHPLTILHHEEFDSMITTSKIIFSQAWMSPGPSASPQSADAPALMAVVTQHWTHFRFPMFLLPWGELGAAGITRVSKSGLRIAE